MFGKTLMIDMYDCAEGVCDDLELHYRFLEALVDELKMTPMIPPIVIHAPVKFYNKMGGKRERIEQYPDKEGVSGWVALLESGCQIHSIEPAHFSSIDIYTCGDLHDENVIEFCRKYFKFKDFDKHYVDRGSRYVPYKP